MFDAIFRKFHFRNFHEKINFFFFVSLVMLVSLFLTTLFLLRPAFTAAKGEDEPTTVSLKRAAPIDLSADFFRPPLRESGVYTITAKDNFTAALRFLNTPAETINEIIRQSAGQCELNQIGKGAQLKYEVVEGEGITRLSAPCGTINLLQVKVKEGSVVVNVKEIPHTRRDKVYACSVMKNSSLISSAARAGIAEKQVMQVAKIFASDVDFNNDIHAGDELRILVNELQDMEGNTLAPGDIKAVLLILGEKEYWAFRYEGPDGKGFFDLNGRSLKKTFLRSPLPFLRVTSGFTLRRFHPILGKERPHLGVDFGAPVGTPVMAAASGKVIEAAWENGYGNVVKIRHGQLTTLYGHLSKIKVKTGQLVKQGQVIGLVGSTGLSTGPHLHYGMYKNGVAIDPMSVKMDTLAVVRNAEFRAFRDKAVDLLRKASLQNR